MLKLGNRIVWRVVEHIIMSYVIEYIHDIFFDPKGDECGRLPLICTTKRGDEGMVRSLLQGGADPNVQDGKGMTPLIHATKQGDEGIVRLLLEHEADPNILDDKGMSALSYAVEHGRRGILEVLLEYGADPDYGVEHQISSYAIEEGSAITNPQHIHTTIAP